MLKCPERVMFRYYTGKSYSGEININILRNINKKNLVISIISIIFVLLNNKKKVL